MMQVKLEISRLWPPDHMRGLGQSSSHSRKRTGLSVYVKMIDAYNIVICICKDFLFFRSK